MTVRLAVPRPLRRASQRVMLGAIGMQANRTARRGRVTAFEVQVLRLGTELLLSMPWMRADRGAAVAQVMAKHGGGQVRGEWVEALGVNTRDSSAVLYLHGGAFLFGSPRTHRGMVAELSRLSGRSVFSVDYRLAPRHWFPAAADDALRAYSWLLACGIPADGIVVAGDSAGGHLALGLSPRAGRAALPTPAGIVALSPVVDLAMELSKGVTDPSMPRVDLVGFARVLVRPYVGDTAVDHPELLLTKDDLAGMPPVLLHASADEIFAADAQHYADALRAAGGTIDLKLWPRRAHVFQLQFHNSRVAATALQEIADFVAERTSPRVR
ncbi:MAG: alpha/beta hydrolase [Aeromicrobium sp.]